jgi:toxin ParE1/3/4
MTRFALAAQAEVDLVDIASYITQDSPKAASRFIERLERIFTMLAASPKLGRLREELAPNLRCFPVDQYLIFYFPAKGGIEVARVLHGARDLPNLF